MADTKKKTRNKQEKPIFQEWWALRHNPVTEEYLKDIAFRMITWSELPDSFILTKFMLTLPHAPMQIYDWAKAHNFMAEALDIARGNIAARREERAAASNPDYYKIYERNQAVYDVPYRDLIKWREDIKPKAQENNGPTTVNVVVPEYAKTDVVKDRDVIPKD